MVAFIDELLIPAAIINKKWLDWIIWGRLQGARLDGMVVQGLLGSGGCGKEKRDTVQWRHCRVVYSS